MSREMMLKGIELTETLYEEGFTPVITGGSWLQIKYPNEMVWTDDVDIICFDFDPSLSEIEIEKRNSNSIEPKKYREAEIIDNIDRGIKFSDDNYEIENGIHYMATNEYWLSAVINKIGHNLSYGLDDRYHLRYRCAPSLAQAMAANEWGTSFNLEKVSGLLEDDRYTNTRFAHLYNDEIYSIASEISARYFLHGNIHGFNLAKNFLEEIIKPLAIEMEIYGKESYR